MRAIAAATGSRSRETSARYEVHRDREPGQNGALRQPIIEEFLGLDRARIAALTYALDGPTQAGERFTGAVRVVQVLYQGDRRLTPTLIDAIDERVASRLLNEVRLPRADRLAVRLEQLQGEVDALLP